MRNFIYKIFIFLKIDYVIGYVGRSGYLGSFVEKLAPPVSFYSSSDHRKIHFLNANFVVQMNDLMSQPLFFGLYMNEILCLKKSFPVNAVVIDVGANVGRWSLLVSQIFKTKKIFAFEPFENTFKNLLKNKINNPDVDLELINAAVGDQIKTVYMKIKDSTNSGMNSICENTDSALEQNTALESITLDHFYSHKKNEINQIDVIKIDVEGYEYHVLRGAEKIISEFQPLIICEIDDQLLGQNQTTPNEIFSFLEKYNYTIQQLPDYSTLSSDGVYKNVHFDMIALPKNRKAESQNHI